MTDAITIGVTTVAFSKDLKLVEALNSKGFKEVIINEKGARFTQEELIAFLQKCDVAIVGLDKIDSSVLMYTPNLKAISKYGVGLDNINFGDCEKHRVKVLHTQGVNKRSVSEMALGYMLSLCRNIYVTSNLLKNGVWNKNGGVQLSGKTIGIIGVGNVGKDLITLLKPFGCNILVNDVVDQNDYYKENNLVEVPKEVIFKEADIISIHTPLTEDTKYLINKKIFKMMKPTAFIINTARGGIVNQEDLKIALKEDLIAGAAIDAYEVEPPQDKELILLPNLINTPHIGGNANEAVQAMGEAAIENIVTFLKKNEWQS